MIDPAVLIDAKRVITSEYAPADSCTLPIRVVLWRKNNDDYALNRRFGTHAEIQQHEGDEFGSFSWGHYDLSFIDAAKDFVARCAQFNCNEF